MQHSKASLLLEPNEKYTQTHLQASETGLSHQHDRRGETGPNPAEAAHMSQQRSGIDQRRLIQGHHDEMGPSRVEAEQRSQRQREIGRQAHPTMKDQLETALDRPETGQG